MTSIAVPEPSANDARVINSEGLGRMPERAAEWHAELAIGPAFEPEKCEVELAELDRPAADDFAAIVDLSHGLDAVIWVGIIKGGNDIDGDGVGLSHGQTGTGKQREAAEE